MAEEEKKEQLEETDQPVSEKKQHSYNRIFGLLVVINIILFGFLVYEIVSLFVKAV